MGFHKALNLGIGEHHKPQESPRLLTINALGTIKNVTRIKRITNS